MAFRFPRHLTDRPARPGSLAARMRRRRAARRSLQVLPTMLTLGNLLCGFLAIFFATRASQQDLPWGWTPVTLGALLVFLGMVFDALDGAVARMTRSTSDLGVQLDSMADMVTFGAAPAVLVLQLVKLNAPFVGLVGDRYFDRAVLLVACIYVACAALRLARFNVESKSPSLEDHLYFKGLPSPGAAGTLASMVLLHQQVLPQHNPLDLPPRTVALALVPVMLLVAMAMVSKLRYVHMANRVMHRRARFEKVAWSVVVGLLLLIEPRAFTAGFVVYALSGPVLWLWAKATGKAVQPLPEAATTSAAPAPGGTATPATPAAAKPPTGQGVG